MDFTEEEFRILEAGFENEHWRIKLIFWCEIGSELGEQGGTPEQNFQEYPPVGITCSGRVCFVCLLVIVNLYLTRLIPSEYKKYICYQ